MPGLKLKWVSLLSLFLIGCGGSSATSNDLNDETGNNLEADGAVQVEADFTGEIEADATKNIEADSTGEIEADVIVELEADGAVQVEADSAADADGDTFAVLENCDSDPCGNGGFCTVGEEPDSIQCDCNDTGFKGAFCEEDIDECASGITPCDVNASCMNTEGGFTCLCNSGFTGDGLECADVDECVEGSASCPSDSACINTLGSYECPCNSGYTANADNDSCVDVDECVEGSASCPSDSACVNTLGSYECPCNPGYAANADNDSCVDVDECEAGIDDCVGDFQCINQPGTYACECASDAPAPVISITSPTRGERIEVPFGEGWPLMLEGMVTDLGLQSVWVNGEKFAVPEGTSEFPLNMEIQTQWGLNIVSITAEDSCGNMSSESFSFLQSEAYFPADSIPGEENHPVISVVIDTDVLDDQNRSDVDDLATILELYLSGLDLSTFFPEIWSVKPDTNGDGYIDTITYFCGFWPGNFEETNAQSGYKVSQNGNIFYGKPLVNMVLPTKNGILVDISIPDFQANLEIQTTLDQGCQGGFSATVPGTVSVSEFREQREYQLVVEEDGLTLQKMDSLFDMNSPDIDFNSETLELFGILSEAAVDSMIDVMGTTMETAIDGYFESLGEPLIREFFGGMGLAPEEVGYPPDSLVSVMTKMTGLSLFDNFDETAAQFTLSAPATPLGTEWVEAESTMGAIRHPSTMNPIEISNDNNFTAVLEDNFFNQIFWALWVQDALNFNEDWLDGVMDGVVDDGLDYTISLNHLVSPVFMPSPEPASGSLMVGFGDIHMVGKLFYPDGSDESIELYASVLAPGVVDVSPGSGTWMCELVDQAEWDLVWSVTEGHEASLAETGPLVKIVLGSALPEVLAGLCMSVPLPMIDLAGAETLVEPSPIPGWGMTVLSGAWVERLEQGFSLRGLLGVNP